MNDDRPNQLYRMAFISLVWGQMKSLWIKYDSQTVQDTGFCPMEIAG